VRDSERHREVGHRQSRFIGERDQPLHRVEAPLITERREEFRASDVVVLSAADPTGEHALTEWSPGQNAHAVLLRDRKDLRLDATVQDRVRRLLGTEPLQAAPFRHPVRLHEVRGRHGRGSERADLAAADEVGQRGQCFLDIRVGIGAVNLIHVDVIGLEAAQ
jgi:hypothetical protein